MFACILLFQQCELCEAQDMPNFVALTRHIQNPSGTKSFLFPQITYSRTGNVKQMLKAPILNLKRKTKGIRKLIVSKIAQVAIYTFWKVYLKIST